MIIMAAQAERADLTLLDDGLLVLRLESVIFSQALCCCVGANLCTRHRCFPLTPSWSILDARPGAGAHRSVLC